ncbi:CAP domain-containing protein [Brevibacillus borstelensis]|uniref:CAP domain-containing protein n=1 Tax=Brevibacillus borstelensis TaxID=45462 RepID=UPI0030BFE0C0
MRKWLWIGVFALSVAGVGRLLAPTGSPLVLASVQPVKLYWDGKEVTDPDKPGYYREKGGHQPAALEYKETTYIPLTLAGYLADKPVHLDKANAAAFVGQAPATQAAAGAKQKDKSSQKPQGAPQPSAVSQAALAPVSVPASARAVDQSANSLFGITLGMPVAQVTKRLGQPARQEPSGLGYQWYIYNQNPARYLQVGIAAGKVVDLYSNAPEAKLAEVGIGTSLSSLSRIYKLQNTVSFRFQKADVQIANQKNQRPLAIQDGIPHIFYLDNQNSDKVTAIRLIDPLMLIRGGFYETRWTYSGTAPHFDPPPMSIKQQGQVHAARERQILDLVNVIRYRYKLPQLHWNEQAAQVARGHSSDMESHDFFDHVSATTGMDPFERLHKAGLSYSMAGENIAAGYPDSIEAHESWMNSPGHRKNVLEKNFTQLGVGVIADYYTQAFVTPKP